MRQSVNNKYLTYFFVYKIRFNPNTISKLKKVRNLF